MIVRDRVDRAGSWHDLHRWCDDLTQEIVAATREWTVIYLSTRPLGPLAALPAPSTQAGGRRGFRVDSRQQPRFRLLWARTRDGAAAGAARPDSCPQR
eukprot:7348668-Prymnesium_polylepis.1